MEKALERTSETSRMIVSMLQQRMSAVAERQQDRLEVKESEHWIGWRSARRDRVFAEMRPSRRKVEVFILPSRRQLEDPRRLARNAPLTQGWGWFRTRFEIVSLAQVGPAFHLIRQSYEHGLRRGNGRAAPHRSRGRGQTSL